jgi:uncharacterized membrane protein YdjX (TVP38/TMEM64 family)
LITVTTPAIREIARSLRGVWSAVVTTTRQVAGWRFAVTAAVVAVLVLLALLVPVPTAVQLRDWAEAAGPWFPLVFLAAHVVVTVLPFPRTAFTLAAGLLFGPWLGVALAVAASALSALATLLVMRAAGWQLSRLVRHPRVDALNARLRERGWPAVVSVRLIPALPFLVINYAAGASAVRALPYTVATLVGLVPGTAAVVILGDALTGDVSPLLFLVSLCTAAVGVALLLYETRSHRRRSRATEAAVAEPAEPAAIG